MVEKFFSFFSSAITVFKTNNESKMESIKLERGRERKKERERCDTIEIERSSEWWEGRETQCVQDILTLFVQRDVSNGCFVHIRLRQVAHTCVYVVGRTKNEDTLGRIGVNVTEGIAGCLA